MRLSIAVIAMSNLPSMRLVSWNTELGVGVIFASRPFFAKRPFSCATQIGQLKPPGKTITLTIWGGAGAAGGGTGSAAEGGGAGAGSAVGGGAGAARGGAGAVGGGAGSAEGAVGAGGTPAHDASRNASTISLLRMVSSFSWFLPVRSELQARQRVRSRHGLQRRLFYSFVFPVFAKLRDVGARAPHAERLRRERELPRPVARFFLGQDVLHAHRIFINHPVGPFEVKKAGRGGRMAARAEYDLHALLAQEIVGAHDVVEILDLVVDVLHAGVRRREQGERVVDGADAQERRVADPVRHARVEEPRPERLVARRVRGAQPDMAEMRDSGVARGKIALAAVKRPHHDLDLVAGRVLEREEPLHAAQLAFLLRAVTHGMAGFLDLRARLVEVVPVLEIEGDDMVRRIAFEIDQRVIARVAPHRCLVAAEIRGLALPARQLQPDDPGRELDRGLQIRRADPQVSDVVEIDHRQRSLRYAYFIRGMPKLGPGFTPSRQREVTVLMRV